MTIRAGTTTSNSSIYFADGTSGDQNYRGQIEYNHNLEIMRFYVAKSERLRIDSSGRLLVGTTSAPTCTAMFQGRSDGATNSANLRLAKGSSTPGFLQIL